MEIKYLEIFTFIFWKKNRFFIKKTKKNQKNYKFKGIITILKIVSLMGHKVYEISLMEHSYHFFALKNNFPNKIRGHMRLVGIPLNGV